MVELPVVLPNIIEITLEGIGSDAIIQTAKAIPTLQHSGKSDYSFIL